MSLAPKNLAQFHAGYEDGWMAYEHGEPVGCPVGVDDDYDFGWWVGVAEAEAWHKGADAATTGAMVCPYDDGEDTLLRERWLQGYAAALKWTDARHEA